ncbi:hypothetical protein KJ951_01575, partial [Patescibacteria group bacterium]|nr:hypothetical protein [Patescibacteria group bacterium]MBU1703070.1 hypothetical protein [Patescibacteria group bacterium]MBU1954163.1 hypothetical protein [Patescibacteria group bacterium]
MIKDLQKPATKGDLMLTKKELRKEMSDLSKGLRGEMTDMRGEIGNIKVDILDIRGELRDIRANMYTKADHMKFMEWMDEAMTELRDTRDERRLSESHMLRMDDTLGDHEKRIVRLEKAA